MATPTLEELREVWTARATDSTVGEATGLRRPVLDALADGRPASAEDLAAASGLPLAQIEAWLTEAAAAGYETDDEGRIVGAALTLNPTSHHIRVRGNDLYAWCGFDTLFLPILIGEEATVASTCPVSGTAITLRVAEDGTVSEVRPPTAVVAIVGREVTSCCTTTGPSSDICTQMPFFADRDAGETWLADHPGVAIVDLDDAVGLARGYADAPVHVARQTTR